MFQPPRNARYSALSKTWRALPATAAAKPTTPSGTAGPKAEAERLGVPFLGEVPLHMHIREAGDTGAPIVSTRPESDEAAGFWAVAEALIETLETA